MQVFAMQYVDWEASAQLDLGCVILSSRMLSREKDITNATQEKRGCGVGLEVNPKKGIRGWTPNPWAIRHLYKPIVQHSTT